jgi:hypothetical protein
MNRFIRRALGAATLCWSNEGRVVATSSGAPIRDATLTLFIRTGAAVDSMSTVSDANGLYSLAAQVRGITPDTLALRVAPPGRPSYLIDRLNCQVITRWGDACVLDPIVEALYFPLFRFVDRANRGVSAARVTFRRSGGAALVDSVPLDSVTGVTDAAGYLPLFGSVIHAGGLEPVVGTLTVDLPAPIGRTTREFYEIRATSTFNTSPFVQQPVGPSLSYFMAFTDSASGSPVPGVEMRFTRTAGIATGTDTMTFVSDAAGRAFVTLTPLAQGSLVGDFFIKPKTPGPITTIAGVSLSTFEADSSVVLSRWKVGANGALFATPPP